MEKPKNLEKRQIIAFETILYFTILGALFFSLYWYTLEREKPKNGKI
jgi:hypothetical protein